MGDAHSIRLAAGLVAVGLGLGGCYSGLTLDAGPVDEGPAAGGPDSDEPPGPEEPPASEDDEDLAPVSGLRRLTATEYDQTVLDLLGDAEVDAALKLPIDERSPFDNDFTAQTPSQALIEGAEILAGEIAERLIADPQRLDQVVGCEPDGSDDHECFDTFVASLGRRALRRPWTAEDQARYAPLLEYGIEDGDFDVAVAAVVRALLQEPEFLYRVERGTPVEGQPGLFRLDDWEVATRLSYLLWGSSPDDALLDAAAAGDLSTAKGVRAFAQEMLEDERAHDRISRFFAMWLGYESTLGGSLAGAMQAETDALLERVLFEERRPWNEIFTADETFVTDELAVHYGLPSTGSSQPQWVSYGDSGRAGILSHGSFLSVGGTPGDTSPIQRGLNVRSQILCQPVPPPPPGALEPEGDTDHRDHEDGPPVPECKWDEAAAHRNQGTCAGCHEVFEAIGFGLENYDETGAFRAHDPGRPECEIEGQGSLVPVGDFNGPGELGQRLIDTGMLDECMVTQFLRFASGRSELDDGDQALVDALVREVGEDPFTFDALLLQYVSSSAFRHRREEEI